MRPSLSPSYYRNANHGEIFFLAVSIYARGTDALDCRLKKLISNDPYFLRTKFVERNLGTEWVHKSRKVVLVGNAAHPLDVRISSISIN